MGSHAVVKLGQLDYKLILNPERYDPRRYKESENLIINDIAEIIREQVYPGNNSDDTHYLVIDTSNADKGIITMDKDAITRANLGSTKKIVRVGDVIISRLRPYLHQIAYIDNQLAPLDNKTVLTCSTEFFVLRSRNGKNISFLVPYLLSKPVQDILLVSQEGGLHPRFNQKALETIPIPNALVNDRDYISLAFESAVASIREANVIIQKLIDTCST